MNQEYFYKLLAGEKRGFCAALIRAMLNIASLFYRLAVAARNLLYNHRIFKIKNVNAAVISIGNITTGGTGKTPLVAWLSNEIIKDSRRKTQDCRLAILTRGYKTQATSDERQAANKDEPGLLAQNCPDAKVIVNPDRVAGAAEAIEKYGTNVLIMDDGFQHRRLARDLDIVAIDATMPFGYGKLLPAGLLRETVNALQRADAVIITRCDQIDSLELEKLEQKLKKIKPALITACSTHAPVFLQFANNKMELSELRGKKVFAFCGIGNPNAFLSTLQSLNAQLAGSEIFNDHYKYTKSCLDGIYKKAKAYNAELIITTQKDYTKISEFSTDTIEIPLGCLMVEIKFLSGCEQLTGLIDKTLAGRIYTS